MRKTKTLARINKALPTLEEAPLLSITIVMFVGIGIGLLL